MGMKARCVAASATFAVALGMLASAPLAQPAGPIAAYAFDEGTSTVAGDTSGNLHAGTVTGATWTSQGRFGNALAFDGINDSIAIGDAAGLDLTTRMTLEAWVYPTALGDWRTVILKERASGLAYALYASDNASRSNSYVNAGGTDVDATASTAVPLNSWSHLAATYDGTMTRAACWARRERPSSTR